MFEYLFICRDTFRGPFVERYMYFDDTEMYERVGDLERSQ